MVSTPAGSHLDERLKVAEVYRDPRRRPTSSDEASAAFTFGITRRGLDVGTSIELPAHPLTGAMGVVHGAVRVRPHDGS